MDFKLAGKRAVVLASSAGIGRAVAKTLSEEGALVAICGRDPDQLRTTAKEIGAALSTCCDLTIQGSATHLVQRMGDIFGGVDILVTNAGGPPKGSFESLSLSDWQTGFDGLWQSSIEAIKEALPLMRSQRWGRIIILTSVAGKEPIEGLSISNALRAGLHGMANSLSREVAGDGITVNCVMPGYTKTERLDELGLSEEELSFEIPAQRLAKPREIAALTAFLSSELAGYITGQAIACDGGYLRSI